MADSAHRPFVPPVGSSWRRPVSQLTLAELLYYSVDGIITNDPATLHHMWKETLE